MTRQTIRLMRTVFLMLDRLGIILFLICVIGNYKFRVLIVDCLFQMLKPGDLYYSIRNKATDDFKKKRLKGSGTDPVYVDYVAIDVNDSKKDPHKVVFHAPTTFLLC